jgi:hypothetical protein
MASQKATYWMAVGLLALVVGNNVVSKLDHRCLAYKVRAAAERVSAQSDHLMAVADVMLGRTSTRFDRAQTALAMAQTRLASVQTSMARQEAVCARVEAVRARMIVRQQLQQMQIPVVVSRPHLQMVIPAPVVATNEDPI